MRKPFSFFPLILALPLAACFDVELSLDFPGEDRAEATMIMVATPDFYAMTTSTGEDFCEGEESMRENGDHVCTETKSGTVDEIMSDPDFGDGMIIERRDGGLIYVAFDLGDISDDIAPPEEEGGDEMIAMMREAFEGHAITLRVSGDEIVETNGTISEDGTTAVYEIPLSLALDGGASLPETFNVLLNPGR
ncbi:hypothetical protein [Sinisalibacter lacisalsi]|uniref:Uncharacterized protein n=1 Tax=Sinisalibacter lacisalsi TaxID=1526570 RepID=A0ABQ1QCA1_9RHOB|nr:hypothetical protein [Sinisalibacter lacisalsi]GGD21843.1 hypothetical protein GCM10011358_02910 [Sinisalibacter lacisalsi]